MPIALVSGPEKAPPIQPLGEPSGSKDWLVISHHVLTSFPSTHPHQRFEPDHRTKGRSVGTKKQGQPLLYSPSPTQSNINSILRVPVVTDADLQGDSISFLPWD